MKYIDTNIFNIDLPSATPALGAILIAEPFLAENWFRHSVICMVDYEAGQPAMGVVMNRPSGQSLDALIDGVTTDSPIPVWVGGPMSLDRLYFIHTLGDLIPGSRPIARGLFIGGDLDEMLTYINGGLSIEGNVRFFVGYSGWSPGQLEQEIAEHVWAVDTPQPISELLTGGEDRYWHRYVRRLGPSHRHWLYHPINSHLN